MKKKSKKNKRASAGHSKGSLEGFGYKARPPSRAYPAESIHSLEQLKVLAIYSLLGVGALTGLYFLGRYTLRKIKRTHTESQSLQEGNPANYAKQLKMAFDNDNWAGWGTNEKLVFQIFHQIPSLASYKKTQNAYKNLYGEDLSSRLESELSSEEFSTVMSIIKAKQ
ncbi:MAG: hypothetical protein MUF42_12185 [Cytophagaceae bacterium]|jgi:hypothetical protein|nr:hypothetical protein [Cytophagaceae bacterium]